MSNIPQKQVIFSGRWAQDIWVPLQDTICSIHLPSRLQMPHASGEGQGQFCIMSAPHSCLWPLLAHHSPPLKVQERDGKKKWKNKVKERDDKRKWKNKPENLFTFSCSLWWRRQDLLVRCEVGFIHHPGMILVIIKQQKVMEFYNVILRWENVLSKLKTGTREESSTNPYILGYIFWKTSYSRCFTYFQNPTKQHY